MDTDIAPPTRSTLISASQGSMSPISSSPLNSDYDWDDQSDSDLELDGQENYWAGPDFLGYSSGEDSDIELDSLDSCSLHSMDIPSDFSDDDIFTIDADPHTPPASESTIMSFGSPDAEVSGVVISSDVAAPPASTVMPIGLPDGEASSVIISPDADPHTPPASTVMPVGSPGTDSHQPLASSAVNQCLPSLTTGYKLVFDNWDTNIRPRYMRSDSQTKSFHFVQAYGVHDRINYSAFTCHKSAEINLYDQVLMIMTC